MSERERWIIYPLLFLALGAAMRDKIFNLTRSQKVVCEGLAVYHNGDPQHPVAILGAERMGIVPAIDFLNVNRVRANVIDADEIRHRGKPVNLTGSGGTTITPAQFLQLLKSMGVVREAAPQPEPTPEPPPSENPPRK